MSPPARALVLMLATVAALAAGGATSAFAPALAALAAGAALGLLHLELRLAQNAFLSELEEFLAERTELPSPILGGEASLPAYLEALLRQLAESLLDAQRLFTRADEERAATQAAVRSLTEQLAALSDQLRAEHKVMLAFSKSHTDLQPLLQDFTQEVARGIAGGEELRDHVRRIDVALARLTDEVALLRDELPRALRQEARTLAQAGAARRPAPEPALSR